MPELSIVLGCLDRPGTFLDLYTSIQKFTQGVDWELVVSDASRITPLDPASFPAARIIKEEPRLGHVKGYNQAFRQARGEYVVWLNDDCLVTEDWAKNALQYMRARSDVGMGALYYCVWGEPYFYNEYWGMPYANFGIIKRELGEQLKWFDEEMYFYGADNSLAFKVFLSGKLVRAIPSARVIHRPYTDIYRRSNESHQPLDASILNNKYQHLADDMLRVHRSGNP